jgi:DNA helicase II / ATP-dependent DNA helicase PcrA
LKQPIKIEDLWSAAEFKPNPDQEKAIRHTKGPLFLTAGPGSGKTRVLLWRAVNLIVFEEVPPEEILLGTFTEKAAAQLKQGLGAYLGEATNRTGKPYDLSRMAIGTIHSICRHILYRDRRFSEERHRRQPVLFDELDQYFLVHQPSTWDRLTEAGDLKPDANQRITEAVSGRASMSRHAAVGDALSLFNRFSEELLDPRKAARRCGDGELRRMIKMYSAYLDEEIIDLSLLQKAALEQCRATAGSEAVFRHVIVDEYQDTNTVQEALLFQLAGGHKNLCVVGDDDQALYRFRGATVENLVEFPDRCRLRLKRRARRVDLGRNYRSRKDIVGFYGAYMSQIDWRRRGGGSHRVENKRIVAERRDKGTAVVASSPSSPGEVCAEVAELVSELIEKGKVADANQIAFLYPSLKSTQVPRMVEALETMGLKVFAPRAATFLDVQESLELFGVYLLIFGRPDRGGEWAGKYGKYQDWLDEALKVGRRLARADRRLAAFIKVRREEIEALIRDRGSLLKAIDAHQLEAEFDKPTARKLGGVKRLTQRTARYLRSRRLARWAELRREGGHPLTVGQVISRATTLDWGVLDLFYQMMAFEPFVGAFDAAQEGGDEGPVCNLSLISQYLVKFQEQYGPVIGARFLDDSKFSRTFFSSFLYALYRRGESQYEDAEDPFPKGRIPFLTIHQAKGLEFPVVVLGNPRKNDSTPQRIEKLVRPIVGRKGEPIDKIAHFDAARLFYVALSRPRNLLVLCDYRGRGQAMNEEFRYLLDEDMTRIPDLDIDDLPSAPVAEEDELPKAYSYTGDYLSYRTCPRRYMIYRRYDFVPSRAQTMLFGSLVHRTIEDLHQWLISRTQGES